MTPKMTPTERRQDVSRRLLDLFFPNRCGCCGERIPYRDYVCETCANELRGLLLSRETLDAALKEPLPWDGFVGLYPYMGAARDGILTVKQGLQNFCLYVAPQLADLFSDTFPGERADMVTCIPMNPKRKREKGFSHAEMLASAVAERLRCPFSGELLYDNAGVLRQRELPPDLRKIYAQTRFSRTDVSLEGKTVLLCDDIMTTGSSLKNCVNLLREMGAQKVYAAVVCCNILPGILRG